MRVSYGPEVDAKLEAAEQLFKEFDVDNNGFLEESEISKLIIKTYAQIGINNV